MNYLRNPLNASHGIKRDDANIAQTVTLRGEVCGDHQVRAVVADTLANSNCSSFLQLARRRSSGRLGVVRRFNAFSNAVLDLSILVRLIKKGDQLRLTEICAELDACSIQTLHARRIWNLPRVLPMRLDVPHGSLSGGRETLPSIRIERPVEALEISRFDLVHVGHYVLPAR